MDSCFSEGEAYDLQTIIMISTMALKQTERNQVKKKKREIVGRTMVLSQNDVAINQASIIGNYKEVENAK